MVVIGVYPVSFTPSNGHCTHFVLIMDYGLCDHSNGHSYLYKQQTTDIHRLCYRFWKTNDASIGTDRCHSPSIASDFPRVARVIRPSHLLPRRWSPPCLRPTRRRRIRHVQSYRPATHSNQSLPMSRKLLRSTITPDLKRSMDRPTNRPMARC